MVFMCAFWWIPASLCFLLVTLGGSLLLFRPLGSTVRGGTKYFTHRWQELLMRNFLGVYDFSLSTRTNSTALEDKAFWYFAFMERFSWFNERKKERLSSSETFWYHERHLELEHSPSIISFWQFVPVAVHAIVVSLLAMRSWI